LSNRSERGIQPRLPANLKKIHGETSNILLYFMTDNLGIIRFPVESDTFLSKMLDLAQVYGLLEPRLTCPWRQFSIGFANA
jgi:hypothetical protein